LELVEGLEVSWRPVLKAEALENAPVSVLKGAYFPPMKLAWKRRPEKRAVPLFLLESQRLDRLAEPI
jgi:hypothetical protein